MNKIWRAINRLANKIDGKAERFKNAKVWPLYFVMPASFLGSFLIPNSFIESLIKKRYGLTNEDDLNAVPAETRDLLQEVLDDMKESEVGLPRRLIDNPSQDLALYKCKGNEIVIHRLVDIRAVAFRVLIGVPPHLLDSTTGENQNSPVSSRNPCKTSLNSPFIQSSSLPQLTGNNESSELLENVQLSCASSKTSDSSLGSLGDALVHKENCSPRSKEQEEGEKSETLDYVSDIPRWEKKFAFLREIVLLRQYLGEEAVFFFILTLAILSSYFAPLHYTLIYMNILTVNGLIIKFHRCNGNIIKKKCHKKAFKILTSSGLQNHSDYIMGGRKYCMRRLKENCNTYKLQRRKAESSLKDKFYLYMNVVFHRFVPDCENVYNCAGGIRAWPANYFNSDFFWAYHMQKHVKELSSLMEEEGKHK